MKKRPRATVALGKVPLGPLRLDMIGGARAGDRTTARRAGHGLCPYYETQFRFYPRLTSLEADPLDSLFADRDAA